MGRGFYSSIAVDLAVALAVILSTVTLSQAAEPTFVTDLTNRVQIGPPTCENVRRTGGQTRTAFCLYLEGDSGRYPYADFVRNQFLADAPVLARQITAVHLSCYKDQGLDQSFFQVLAPSRKILNNGGGFVLRMGCDQSFMQLKRRVAQFTRVLRALQPFARESLAQALELEPRSPMLEQLQLLLSGEIREPLSKFIACGGITWNVSAAQSASHAALAKLTQQDPTFSESFWGLRTSISQETKSLLFNEAQRLRGRDSAVHDPDYYRADTPARRAIDACNGSQVFAEDCPKLSEIQGELSGLRLWVGDDGPMLEYYSDQMNHGFSTFQRTVLYRFQGGFDQAVEAVDFFGPKIEFELDSNLNRKCIAFSDAPADDSEISRLIQELESAYSRCPPAQLP